jgi:hypothetical protein
LIAINSPSGDGTIVQDPRRTNLKCARSIPADFARKGANNPGIVLTLRGFRSEESSLAIPAICFAIILKNQSAMKPLLVAAIALSMISIVEAKKKDEEAANPQQQQQDKEKQKEEEKNARGAKRKAVQEILDAKDKNHDGSLSKEEYVAGEADPEAAAKTFDQFNKNKDRFLSKGEIGESLGL